MNKVKITEYIQDGQDWCVRVCVIFVCGSVSLWLATIAASEAMLALRWLTTLHDMLWGA